MSSGKFLVFSNGQFYADPKKHDEALTYFKEKAARYNEWEASEAVAASNGSLQMVEEEFAHVFSDGVTPQHVWNFLMTKFELVNEAFTDLQSFLELIDQLDDMNRSRHGSSEDGRVRFNSAINAVLDTFNDGIEQKTSEKLNKALFGLGDFE